MHRTTKRIDEVIRVASAVIRVISLTKMNMKPSEIVYAILRRTTSSLSRT
jgi:hypothetical protein